jgi:gamma-glutamyl:cysteine ligase YbdK (ATP-grasp superfamily)
MSEARYGMFQRFGVELEFIIVDAETLAVRTVADRLLTNAAGEPASEISEGPLNWSNELVLHVLEMKTGEPAPTLHGLAARFQQSVLLANQKLAPWGAQLLGTGMHPTMDPAREMKLWPHEYGTVYRTFDRIFDCRGHGWANLQSTHLNLPFENDDEFARLHAAIRVVLPLLPALAASSPLLEGRTTRWLDTRLEMYRNNAARVPSVSGLIVPEPATSEGEYRDLILGPIYRDLEPHDPEGVLRNDWVNARGAIARFERGTIEIRVIDSQECVIADLAIAGAVTSVVRLLTEEATAPVRAMNALATDRLAATFQTCITHGDTAMIEGRQYLELFGWRRGSSCRASELWSYLIERSLEDGPDRPHWERALEIILSDGCLARRILRRTGAEPSRQSIQATYRALAVCLERGTQLRAG